MIIIRINNLENIQYFHKDIVNYFKERCNLVLTVTNFMQRLIIICIFWIIE